MLLLGVSTRALAESATRSGARVAAVDFFGDRDQARVTESYALSRDLGLPSTADGLVRAARRLDAEAVVYGANLENHPAAVATLARRHRLLGNEAGVVRKVRDWRLLRRFCTEVGVAYPTTLLAGEEGAAREAGGRWLRKRVRGGGGHGVRRWDGTPLDEAHLLQAEVAGRAASASFVADGRAARVFALSEQLIGDRALGADGFAWCGNIVPFPADGPRGRALVDAVADMASLLTRRFGLRGVNGFDLVVADGPGGALVPHLVEVNPRFTASMELAERLYGANVFALHLEGCAGRLPELRLAEGQAAGFCGKAIVFSKGPVVTPDTDPWLDGTLGDPPAFGCASALGDAPALPDTTTPRATSVVPAMPAVRDIPASGEHIAAGHPVCTVFAVGSRDRDACLTELHRAAATIDDRLQDGGRRREVRRERAADADHWAHA